MLIIIVVTNMSSIQPLILDFRLRTDKIGAFHKTNSEVEKWVRDLQMQN